MLGTNRRFKQKSSNPAIGGNAQNANSDCKSETVGFGITNPEQQLQGSGLASPNLRLQIPNSNQESDLCILTPDKPAKLKAWSGQASDLKFVLRNS
ncbi:MAG: hypothetical protein MUD08_14155 [Cytophagales bacterium]|nr:hypothetical protein [Cytophagales bacterium]